MTYDFPNPGFRSPRNLSLFAIIGFAILILIDLLSILFGIGQIVSPDWMIDLDTEGSSSLWLLVQGILFLLQFPVFIFTAVMFLVWLHRAHKNLSELRPTRLEFTPGWAVGWWFIPFLNLFKPYQVVREVWWESDPVLSDEQPFLSASLHSAPAYMALWWAFWLISNIASNIAGRLYDPDDLAGVAVSGFVFIVSSVLSIVAALLAVHVVRDITRRQEMRAAAVSSLQHNLPPPPPEFR